MNSYPAADVASPADRRSLTHQGASAERGKPVALPHEGKRAARRADRAAGMGSRSKRMPACNEPDRG